VTITGKDDVVPGRPNCKAKLWDDYIRCRT